MTFFPVWHAPGGCFSIPMCLHWVSKSAMKRKPMEERRRNWSSSPACPFVHHSLAFLLHTCRGKTCAARSCPILVGKADALAFLFSGSCVRMCVRSALALLSLATSRHIGNELFGDLHFDSRPPSPGTSSSSQPGPFPSLPTHGAACR